MNASTASSSSSISPICEKMRQLYKQKSTTPLRELMRQHCLDRIKQKRQKLLDKLRGTEEGQYAASADDFRIECERFAQVHAMPDEELDLLLRMHDEIQAELAADQEPDFLICDSFSSVVCPICMKSYIQQSGNIFHCACGMKVTSRNPNASLPQIGADLQQLVDQHASECFMNPRFFVENSFNCENLILCCDACQFLAIVF